MTHPNDNKLTRISVTAGLTYGAATEITLSNKFFSIWFFPQTLKGDYYNGVFVLNEPTGLDLDKTNRKLYLINKGSHIVLEYTIVSTNFLTRIVGGVLNEEGEGFSFLFIFIYCLII